MPADKLLLAKLEAIATEVAMGTNEALTGHDPNLRFFLWVGYNDRHEAGTISNAHPAVMAVHLQNVVEIMGEVGGVEYADEVGLDPTKVH